MIVPRRHHHCHESFLFSVMHFGVLLIILSLMHLAAEKSFESVGGSSRCFNVIAARSSEYFDDVATDDLARWNAPDR